MSLLAWIQGQATEGAEAGDSFAPSVDTTPAITEGAEAGDTFAPGKHTLTTDNISLTGGVRYPAPRIDPVITVSPGAGSAAGASTARLA